jgi:hypothetical protein
MFNKEMKMTINTVAEFDQALENGAYAWPGGYPLFFLMSDGETLSFAAAKAESDLIRAAIADKSNDGWRVIAVDVNWEDGDLTCSHTGERIESAYAE